MVNSKSTLIPAFIFSCIYLMVPLRLAFSEATEINDIKAQAQELRRKVDCEEKDIEALKVKLNNFIVQRQLCQKRIFAEMERIRLLNSQRHKMLLAEKRNETQAKEQNKKRELLAKEESAKKQAILKKQHEESSRAAQKIQQAKLTKQKRSEQAEAKKEKKAALLSKQQAEKMQRFFLKKQREITENPAQKPAAYTLKQQQAKPIVKEVKVLPLKKSLLEIEKESQIKTRLNLSTIRLNALIESRKQLEREIMKEEKSLRELNRVKDELLTKKEKWKNQY